MNKKLTLGSLFSGSGGFELGGMLAGITPVWASEVAPFPIRVTTKRMPFVKHYGDVSKMNGAKIEPVDIITFGSPCQDWSIAGKRVGISGQRSGLYTQAVRIVKEMLEATNREFPKFCVFENVPGLLSSNKGKDFTTCLDMMQSLGFLPDPNILDAQDMGVPQRRKRVFIVWVNVDYILSKRIALSRSITLQLHTEILQTILAGLLKASGEELKKSVVNDARFAEDGLRKRIKLFSLQEESRLSMLQSVLDEIQAMYGTEQKNLDGNHGGGQTVDTILTAMDTKSITLKTEMRSGHIEWSLKKESDEALNLMKSSITSTLTKETINRKTCFYLKVLLNTLDVIIHLMQSQKESDAILNQQYEWVLHTLIWLEGYTNAKCKHDKSIERMEWNDCLRFLKSSISSCKKILVADFRGQSAGKILFESEGVSGYSAESFRAWQRAAGNFEKGTGAPSVCLNDQGGSRMDVTHDVTATLRAEAHHPPCVMSAGFCTEHSAKARSIGYEEEKSPTLRAGIVPAAITLNERQYAATVSEDLANTLTGTDYKGVQLVFENHAADARCAGPLDVAPTMSSTYGTGGNNQPFVVKKDCFDVRFTSEGTKNARHNVYATNTARTIDTGGNAPANNQGGVAVVESYSIQGSAIGRDDKNGPQGSGINKDVSFTLNTTDRHAVYAIDRAAYNQGKNARYDFSITDSGTAQTVVARGPGAVAVEPVYTVRRLTPIECGRLQGFPDWWVQGLETENPSEDDLKFWRGVFDEYARINGTKPKSDKQIIKWLKNPYSDSAVYKMWGNGLAAPCAFFVLAGIAYYADMM